MDSLKNEVSNQIKDAMRARDKIRLNALRYLKKLFIENDTSKKPIAELDIVISYTKKVRDSIASYPEGSEQKNILRQEVTILEEFLPEQLTEQDVVNMIQEIKANMEDPNMGAIMKELSPKIKGVFDGKKASLMVKESIK